MSVTGLGPAPALPAELDPPPRLSGAGASLGALWHSPNGRVGLVLVGVVVAAAIAASFGGTPYDPQFQNAAALLQHPSWSHPFGTDQFGRDILSLVLDGLGRLARDRLPGGADCRSDRHHRRSGGRFPRSVDFGGDHACDRHDVRDPGDTARSDRRRRARCRLAEQRHRNWCRLYPDLRPGGPGTGAGAARVGLRARRAGYSGSPAAGFFSVTSCPTCPGSWLSRPASPSPGRSSRRRASASSGSVHRLQRLR